jgi:hypothetical protein
LSASNPKSAKPSVFERIAVAFVVGLIYALLLYNVIWSQENTTLPFIGGLFLLPMGVAGLATSIADPRGEKTMEYHVYLGWTVVAVALVFTVVFFSESMICVAMGLPLFAVASGAGSALTFIIMRKFRSPGRATFLVVLPLIGLPIEPHITYPDHLGEVTTIVEIAAPVETVWRNTVEIRNIDPSELKFTFSHGVLGIPQPEDASLEGEGTSAVRHLKWTKDIRFEEVITAWETNRFLAWDFRFSQDSIPSAIEAHIDVNSSYLKMTNGDYRLEPLPNGNTRLTLTSRYRIRTPINIYCDWWGQIFLNDFHGVVMNVIKTRSETSALN